MTLIKKLLNTLVILIVFIFILEVSSYFVLRINGNLSAVQSSFVFKSVSKNGNFIPNKEFVLPIKENADFTWTERDFSVQVRTNSYGLREDFEVKLEDVEIAVFGDSFTFGHGVNVEQRYSNIINTKISKNSNLLVNFSYKNGFQPEHYEFYLRSNPELRPKTIIVGLYLGNDLGSDVLETQYDSNENILKIPYRRIFSEGQIANNPSAFRFPLNFLADNSFFSELFLKVVGKTKFRANLFKAGFEGPNSLNSVALEKGNLDLFENPAAKSLLRIDKYANSIGSDLLVLVIPQNYFFGSSNPHLSPLLQKNIPELIAGRNLLSSLMDFCASTKLKCLDPSNNLDETSYFKNDGHWTSIGHRQIAEFVFKYLQK
jgi:hypothetical protein